jgi:hypothetical protein
VVKASAIAAASAALPPAGGRATRLLGSVLLSCGATRADPVNEIDPRLVCLDGATLRGALDLYDSCNNAPWFVQPWCTESPSGPDYATTVYWRAMVGIGAR